MALSVYGVCLTPVVEHDFDYGGNPVYRVEVLDQNGAVWASATTRVQPTQRQLAQLVRKAAAEVAHSVKPHLKGAV